MLHTYAGLLRLRLALFAETDFSRGAQGTWKASTLQLIVTVETNSLRNIGQSNDASNQTLLREAQQHLERACALDPEGGVAQTFLRKVRPSVSCDGELSRIVN